MKRLVLKSVLGDFEGLQQILAGIGLELSAVVWQHDRVYVPRGYRYNENHPRMVLRTEVVTPEETATYKLYLKRHIVDSGVDLVYGSEVGMYTEVMEMIHQLGFEKLAEVSRQRRTVALDEAVVLYVDEVEGLEPYLKLETWLENDEPVEPVWQDMLKIMEMLGQTAIVAQTYAELLAQKAMQGMVAEQASGY